ncbi:hypothetical protein Tco_0221273 [Tanacetum coccineum]
MATADNDLTAKEKLQQIGTSFLLVLELNFVFLAADALMAFPLLPPLMEVASPTHFFPSSKLSRNRDSGLESELKATRGGNIQIVLFRTLI